MTTPDQFTKAGTQAPILAEAARVVKFVATTEGDAAAARDATAAEAVFLQGEAYAAHAAQIMSVAPVPATNPAKKVAAALGFGGQGDAVQAWKARNLPLSCRLIWLGGDFANMAKQMQGVVDSVHRDPTLTIVVGIPTIPGTFGKEKLKDAGAGTYTGQHKAIFAPLGKLSPAERRRVIIRWNWEGDEFWYNFGIGVKDSAGHVTYPADRISAWKDDWHRAYELCHAVAPECAWDLSTAGDYTGTERQQLLAKMWPADAVHMYCPDMYANWNLRTPEACAKSMAFQVAFAREHKVFYGIDECSPAVYKWNGTTVVGSEDGPLASDWVNALWGGLLSAVDILHHWNLFERDIKPQKAFYSVLSGGGAPGTTILTKPTAVSWGVSDRVTVPDRTHATVDGLGQTNAPVAAARLLRLIRAA